MGVIEIVIISVAVGIVAAVLGVVIWRKVKGKGGCSGCDCASCKGCAAKKKPIGDKNESTK